MNSIVYHRELQKEIIVKLLSNPNSTESGSFFHGFLKTLTPLEILQFNINISIQYEYM